VLVRTELFETAAIVAEAKFVQARTTYSRIGDLVAYLSITVTVLGLVIAIRGRRS
jgi:apolipoprotein N-acyltransferase